MKKTIAVLLLITFFLTLVLAATAQRKVWNDDRRPEYKGDTSIVVIKGNTYQKVIGVTYKKINEEILIKEWTEARNEIRRMRQEANRRMRQDSITLAKLDIELDQRRSFYRAARKELKFATRDVDDIDKAEELKAKQREQMRKDREAKMMGSIQENPRKRKE